MTAPAAVFRTYTPSLELRPYVFAYMWFSYEGEEPARTFDRRLPDGTIESRFNRADPLLTTMLPTGCLGLSFNFGDPWRIRKGSRNAMAADSSCVLGAATRPAIVDYGPRAGALGVLFQSTFASVFLGVPAGEFTDRIVALDAVWGGAARELQWRLADLRDVREKIRALDAELLRRLRSARWIDHTLQPVAHLIEQERGLVSVESLSQSTGLSRQHLTRKFRQQVGVTPKQYCRYTRFHAFLTRVHFSAHVDWAAAAAEFGYYDQAHMIGEFKEFTGRTPTEFVGRPALPPERAPAVAAD